jgi:Sporulation and spore germination/Immunoglobulin-like domain of bacterial spore germination
MRIRVPFLVVIASLALLLAACGDDSDTTTTDTTADASTTSTAADDTTTSTSDADAETIDLSVYFIDEAGEIRVGWVREIVAPAVAEGTLESLLRGPTDEDEPLGLGTAIPEGTTLNSVAIEGTTGVVDLSAEFATGGDEASAHQRLAQVVYVMTQFPDVEDVSILVDGAPLTTLGDSGVAVEEKLTRSDFQFGGVYEGVEGMILVETPRPGTVVEGPMAYVGGSSNTYEATVYLEGTAADGTVLVPEEFTTATSGSGTPGTFFAPVTFPDGTSGEVVVNVYSLSGEDGSRIGLNAVPFVFE